MRSYFSCELLKSCAKRHSKDLIHRLSVGLKPTIHWPWIPSLSFNLLKERKRNGIPMGQWMLIRSTLTRKWIWKRMIVNDRTILFHNPFLVTSGSSGKWIWAQEIDSLMMAYSRAYSSAIIKERIDCQAQILFSRLIPGQSMIDLGAASGWPSIIGQESLTVDGSLMKEKSG